MNSPLSVRSAARVSRTPSMLFALLVLFSAAHAASPKSPPPPSGGTILVLDASGSMRGRIGGETKMAIAKRSVRELVEAFPDNTPLGLVVYSHRRGNDCKDIELAIPPGPLDKPAFIKAVMAIEPRGMTPLTDAVEFAAQALDYRNRAANVILVSDGEETCGRQPCEVAARLKSLGKDLTVHAVAFDLGEKASRSFACLALDTGGRFLQANDAASLRDALTLAVTESTTPSAPAVERLGPATITAPASVLGGAEFQVAWTGPDNPGDYLSIVRANARDEAYANYSYTRQGSPLTITALIEAGPAEIRYVTGGSHTILARAAVGITAPEVTLQAAAEAPAGGRIEVTWTGPANAGDFVTVVATGASEGDYAGYVDAKDGSPAAITVPIEPGACEIRYVSGQGRKVLARRPLRVVSTEVTLAARDEAAAGETVAVDWTGPANPGDYLTIVPADFPDERYAEYSDASRGSPASMRVPIDPGPCEIRYVSGQGRRVLARRPINLVALQVTLDAAEQVAAGAPVEIAWTGPNFRGDYITIVPKGFAEGRYAEYADASHGSPLEVSAPIDPGDAEIRYVAGQGARTLARRPIVVLAAEIRLEAPGEAVAGSPVPVAWSGGGNRGDYITIVPRDAPDNRYGEYKYTAAGMPLTILTPPEAGECEIRYISGQGARVLVRRALRTTPPAITLRAPAAAAAKSAVAIEWSGPDSPGDFLTIVPIGTRDGSSRSIAYTTGGSPLQVNTPQEAGAAEIRYISSRGHVVLARAPIEITPAK